MLDTVEDKAQQENLSETVDLLLAGEFEKVPEGTCDVSRKLHKLASVSIERAIENLVRTVDMSVTANEGVTKVAEMVRDIQEVDGQSQGIAAAVEELAASVGSISASASSAAEEVEHVAGSAAAGMEAAENAKATMAEISTAVSDAAQKVDQLSEASQQIGAIVEEIEGIAKQTNLLALNATIEAARAGDAGKGFAVVASEVKSLANQTATSTDNIRHRIESLLADMTGIVSSMKEGEEKASKGQEVIASSSDEMIKISDQVDTVNQRIQEITGILSQQTQASDEVSHGVATIAQMSSRNVQTVEHVIDVLEGTEGPIVEGINSLVARGGPNAIIYAAKSDHMIWMRKLAQMLTGRLNLNPDELSDHRSCRFGQWYYAQQDPALTNIPEWKQLDRPHTAAYQQGLEAARLYRTGDTARAVDAVHKANEASKDVMRLLDAVASKRR